MNGESDHVTSIFPPFFGFIGCALPSPRESKPFGVCLVRRIFLYFFSHRVNVSSQKKVFPLGDTMADKVSCLKSFKCRTFRPQIANCKNSHSLIRRLRRNSKRRELARS